MRRIPRDSANVGESQVTQPVLQSIKLAAIGQASLWTTFLTLAVIGHFPKGLSTLGVLIQPIGHRAKAAMDSGVGLHRLELDISL